MELTGTNRPKTYLHMWWSQLFGGRVLVFVFTVWFWDSNPCGVLTMGPGPLCGGGVGGGCLCGWPVVFSVVMARGVHPVPFRTR